MARLGGGEAEYVLLTEDGAKVAEQFWARISSPVLTDVRLELDGQEIRFLPERAALWEDRATLIAADLHWGKSEALQRHGIPLPAGALAADLDRLDAALARTEARRLLVLGDLVHAASSLTPAVVAAVTAWRARRQGLVFALIRGNHERGVVLPEAWRITEIRDGTEEGPFRFSHALPQAAALDGGRPAVSGPAVSGHVWGGHVHPSVVLRSARDRLRLPCFVVGPRSVLLPAFGVTTGTFDVPLTRDQRVFAVADTAVREVQ
jgi:DNA ligase-associated metallophosphoesterase